GSDCYRHHPKGTDAVLLRVKALLEVVPVRDDLFRKARVRGRRAVGLEKEADAVLPSSPLSVLQRKERVGVDREPAPYSPLNHVNVVSKPPPFFPRNESDLSGIGGGEHGVDVHDHHLVLEEELLELVEAEAFVG